MKLCDGSRLPAWGRIRWSHQEILMCIAKFGCVGEITSAVGSPLPLLVGSRRKVPPLVVRSSQTSLAVRRRESVSPPSLHYRAEAVSRRNSAQWLHLLAGIVGCVPSPVIKALWVGSLVAV